MASAIPKEKRIREFLTEAAVADAGHDFQGGRAGESLFSKIFKKFKPIGTPYTPTFDKPENEWGIIDKIIPFLDGTKGETEQTRKFKEVFLKFDPSSPNTPQTIGSFQRYADDPIPYKVQALKISGKTDKDAAKKTEYLWSYSSEELFDHLSDDKVNLYFTIDACNVPFYDLLQKDAGGGAKKATCIYTRESINDAAGKKEFQNIPGKAVSFDFINDSANFNILYPAIQSNTPEEELKKLQEIECFLSIYNLTLSSVDPKNNSVTLSLTNKDMTKQVQVTKHDKEDAHPNSVPTLAEKIKKLIEKLTKPVEQMNYYSYLQQKRSGDWLQCLACTNPARFGLPEQARIKLVTLDKICMAYALFCGIDVIFTYYNQEDRTCWLITFFKERTPPNKEQILQNKINMLPNPKAIEQFVNNPADITYDECYDLYIKYYNEYKAILEKNFEDSSRFKYNTNKSVLMEDIRKYLRAALTLGVFRSVTNKLNGSKPHSIYVDSIPPTVTEQNYETLKKKFEMFQDDYLVLKKTLLSRKNKDNILNAELQIRDYFETIVRVNYEGSAADKKREELVKRLNIFGQLFSSANGGSNGVGIFEFINNTLLNEEKRSIQRKFEEFTKEFENSRSDKKNWSAFLTTISFTMNEEEKEPDITAVSNKDLTEVIQAIDEKPAIIDEDTAVGQLKENIADVAITEESSTVSPGSVNKNASTNTGKLQEKIKKSVYVAEQPSRAFEVTDFGPVIRILAKRLIKDENIWEGRLRSRMTSSKIQEGGSEINGLPPSFHNPLTTFFFLLRELSFRVSYEEDLDDLRDYKQYIQILTSLIKNEEKYIKLMSEMLQDSLFEPIFKYYYYKGFEIYFLEYAQKDKDFPISEHITRDIALSIKKGYYGVENLQNIPENFLLTREFINMTVSSSFEDMNSEIYIDRASGVRNLIPTIMGELEKNLDTSIKNVSEEFIGGVESMLKTNRSLGINIVNALPGTQMLPPPVSVYGGKHTIPKSRKQKLKKILKRPFRKTRRGRK